MVSKIPVLETERFSLKRDGRGLIFPWDADNLEVKAWTTGYEPSGTAASGWLRVRYISGSTYGPTGSTLYVPLYKTV